METDTNKNHGLDDQNSLINQGNQGSIPEKNGNKDDDKIEKEVDTPSQPAEEHLITEADDLHTNDFEQNTSKSSLEDPDQGPEEIDPVNHPRNFQNNPDQKPKRPLVD